MESALRRVERAEHAGHLHRTRKAPTVERRVGGAANYFGGRGFEYGGRGPVGGPSQIRANKGQGVPVQYLVVDRTSRQSRTLRRQDGHAGGEPVKATCLRATGLKQLAQFSGKVLWTTVTSIPMVK